MILASDWMSEPGLPTGITRLAVMDGDCALCSQGARMIARHDRSGEIRICTVSSALGTSLMRRHGLDPADPESWLFLEPGRATTGMDGFIAAGRACGGIGHAVRVLGVLPRPVRDWLYRRIARNRYRLFGRRQMCELPDPALRARLIG
ncbi:thiol-disulfide oxidoreductase DCC family protein [Roseobacter sp. HKCCA0434]|uniref:thiol-disulfide oxidoreductase DCC family protein n=1 Tax=Roseobacter sp. HKCCA0434 TaxID=3079297 RepID=UPI002905F79A|nr:DCC1-like thiol-disulfide oxidoreductase family protein [Roseobacter sp. HKCCA0434]